MSDINLPFSPSLYFEHTRFVVQILGMVKHLLIFLRVLWIIFFVPIFNNEIGLRLYFLKMCVLSLYLCIFYLFNMSFKIPNTFKFSVF